MTTLDLVALPYAGAHMDPFHGLRTAAEAAVPGLASMTVTYPGHGRRISETLAPSVERMAADALTQLLEHRSRTGSTAPVVLLGYSMGALVAYELAHLLSDLGTPAAELLVMASTPPEHVVGTGLSLTGDDELLEHCEQYGILAASSFPDAALRRLFLPALRNDILAVDRYPGPVRGTRPLPTGTRLTVFTGDADPTVSDLPAWADLVDTAVATRHYAGGHFFLTECREALWADVTAALADSARRAGGDPTCERSAA
ncbi:MAG: putative thioesterase [Humibacillus sp.]|nr:putative thioesterase [Humibacillus sp.]